MKATSLWLFSWLPAVGSAFIIQGRSAATYRHVLPVASAVLLYQGQRRIRPTTTARPYQQKLRRSNSAAKSALQMKNQQQKTTKSYSNYSDDFFGLIFLSPVLLGDQVFSTVFLVVSALASIATKATKVLPASPIVPGIVAMMAVVVTAAFRFVAPLQVETPSATVVAVEIVEALCSGAWGYYQLAKLQNESDTSND